MLMRRKDAYDIRTLTDGCSVSRRFATVLLIVLCAGFFSPQQDGRHVCVLANTSPDALRTETVLPSETETTGSEDNMEPAQTTTIAPVVTALDQTGSVLEQTGSTAGPHMPATAIPPTGDVTASEGGGVGGVMTSLPPEVLTASSQNVTGNTPPGASTEPGNSVVQPMQSDSPVESEVSEAATHAPSSTNAIFVPQMTTALEAETGTPPGVAVSNTVEPSTAAGTVSLMPSNVETISPQTVSAGNAGTSTAEVELAPTTERIQNPTEMLLSEAVTTGVQLTTAPPVGTDTMTSSPTMPSTVTNLMPASTTTGVEAGDLTTAVEVGALWTDTTTPAVTTTAAAAAATSSNWLTSAADHTVVSHSSFPVDELPTTLPPAEVSDAAETPAGLLTVEQTTMTNSAVTTVASSTPSPSSAAPSTAAAPTDVTAGPPGATSSSTSPAAEAESAPATVEPPSESRHSTESTAAASRQQTAAENLATAELTQAAGNPDFSTAAFQTSTATTSNVSLPGDQSTTTPTQIVDQSPTPQAQKSASSDSGLSGGEIAAIVVCSIVGGIALIIVLMFFIQRRLYKRSRQRYEFSNRNEIEMRSTY